MNWVKGSPNKRPAEDIGRFVFKEDALMNV